METLQEAAALIFGGDKELWQIIATTLVMSVFSTGISALLGIPLGVLIGKNRFPGKGALLRLIYKYFLTVRIFCPSLYS